MIVRKWGPPGLITLVSMFAVIAVLILFWVWLPINRLFLYTVIAVFLLTAALYRALPAT